MRNIMTAVGAVLLLAGCSSEPTLDVSGEWQFFHGGRFTLVQHGKKLSGSGHILTDNLPAGGSDFRIPLTASGKFHGESIVLTFECGTNTLKNLEFLPAISPKGNQRFLKCPQHLGLTLIPEGVDAFKHEILKPEFTELEKKRERSQQPDGAVTQEPARSAAP
jgi:hypothetical protein